MNMKICAKKGFYSCFQSHFQENEAVNCILSRVFGGGIVFAHDSFTHYNNVLNHTNK